MRAVKYFRRCAQGEETGNKAMCGVCRSAYVSVDLCSVCVCECRFRVRTLVFVSK